MKLHFKKILDAAALLTVSVLAVSGCTSEISMDKEGLDTTVNLGGDAFTLPLGSTAELKIGDFLEIQEDGLIKVDADGNYFITFTQPFDQEISLRDFADQLTVPGLVHNLDPRTLTLPDVDIVPEEGVSGLPDGIPGIEVTGDKVMVALGLEEEFSYEFSFEEAADHGLVSVDRVDFEDTYLHPSVEMETDGNMPETVGMEVVLKVPEHYVFEDSPYVDNENHTVTFSGTMNSEGVIVFPSVSIAAIDFGQDKGNMEDGFVFLDTFAVVKSDLVFSVDDFNAVSGSTISVDLTVAAGSEDGSMLPELFVGRVDVAIDPIQESIGLDGIPDLLKSDDVRLDFYSPSLTAVISTNAGVPVDITADLIPVFAGVDGDGLSLDMSTPVSDDPSVTETVSYWISSSRPDGLSPEYEWLEADLRSLLSRIPDDVDVEVSARTDSGENAYVVCNAEYNVSGEFSFNVPFSFGDGLYLALGDTIPNMPAILSTVVRSANVRILGEVTSTVPLNINMKAYFLDASGNRIDIPEMEQTISGSGADGAPCVTPLELNVPKTEISRDIASIVLAFELLPGQDPGVPVSDKSSVQADIVLEVPGGITFDLEDLENIQY